MIVFKEKIWTVTPKSMSTRTPIELKIDFELYFNISVHIR